MYIQIDIGAEGEIEWAAVGDARDDVGWLNGGFGTGGCDAGCCKKVPKDGGKAVANSIVAAPFGDFGAVEDMHTLGVDGCATDAGGKVGGRVDVEM